MFQARGLQPICVHTHVVENLFSLLSCPVTTVFTSQACLHVVRAYSNESIAPTGRSVVNLLSSVVLDSGSASDDVQRLVSAGVSCIEI